MREPHIFDKDRKYKYLFIISFRNSLDPPKEVLGDDFCLNETTRILKILSQKETVAIFDWDEILAFTIRLNKEESK